MSRDRVRPHDSMPSMPCDVSVHSTRRFSAHCALNSLECDIHFEKEIACVAVPMLPVFVSCSILSQICRRHSSVSCISEQSRCGDPCDVETCGAVGTTISQAELRSDLFQWPVPSSHQVILPFGVYDSDSSCGIHTAVDIGASEGSLVVAAARGRVVHVGYLWVRGVSVGRGPAAIVIRHADNLYTVYSHNRKALTAVGLCVEAGQAIAEAGQEGYARDIPHLHFEILFEAEPTNKELFFSKIWSVPFFSPCSFYKDFQKLFFLTGSASAV